MKNVDILIKNGKVIDNYNNFYGVEDIAIKDGFIVESKNVKPEVEIDAQGLIVSPGLIDFHTHVSYLSSEMSIIPDISYIPMGVTTIVDAGTTGVSNYKAILKVINDSNIVIKSLLNLCSTGLSSYSFYENLNLKTFNKDKLKLIFDKYPDIFIGLKIRLSKYILGEVSINYLRSIISIAEDIGVPLFIHTTDPALNPKEILNLLRSKDVYIHLYQGKGNTIVENNKIIKELKEAREKGVIFDAANGGNHFSFKVCKKAIEEGFIPDIISTDLTVKTLYKGKKVFTLPFIMSKYLNLGLSIEEVFKTVTTNPANYLREGFNLGSLSEGSIANIAILELKNGEIDFHDFENDVLKGNKYLENKVTILNGEIVYRDLRC